MNGRPAETFSMTYSDLAMVIPVWFGEAVPDNDIRGRLHQTLAGGGYSVDPSEIAVSLSPATRPMLPGFLPAQE